MSARECPCCVEGRNPGGACKFCNGTGKVWPSVEGEIVGECAAVQMEDGGPYVAPSPELPFIVPGPGRYRAIVQKIGVV